MHPPQPPQDATDIFSITDEVLAERLQFIEEIGFGNWGSVWLCRPKVDPSSSSDLPNTDSKIAVKLVHRSKTPTTAARVKSLWNEMKVVRSFKHEPHPSIIPFYSFIITPSYAMITMAYHRKLVPVEVGEHHAKDWFRSLLSGIEFLHKRGVVHNDIKPANILLSNDNVPVLVDFGFAERYDLSLSTAFHSNLSYGTPEYLSPERARGLQHDTRKSDVWSLGITFFEILIGRTPFEHGSGEQFSTKEDLERYWCRTMKGKWVGSWKMSKHVEKLFKRMIAPNADVRCTASDAMADAYWSISTGPPRSHAHKKSASVSQVLSPSLTANLNTDASKLFDTIPSWTSRSGKEQAPDVSGETTTSVVSTPSVSRKTHKRTRSKIPVLVDKENSFSPSSTKSEKEDKKAKARHARSQSQPKLMLEENKVRGTSPNRRGLILPSLLSTFSPLKSMSPSSDIVTSTPSSRSSNVFASPVDISQPDENFTPSPSPAPIRKRAVSNVRPTRKPMGPRQTPPRTPQHTLTSQERKDIVAFLNFTNVSNPDASPSVEKERCDTARSRGSARSKTDMDKENNRKSSTSKRRMSSVFSDFASTAKNIDLSAHTLPSSSSKELRRERSAGLSEIDLPGAMMNGKESSPPQVFIPPSKPANEGKKGSVRDRMREWERERERLREMQRLEERLREAEEERNELVRQESGRLEAEIEEEQIQQAKEASEREEAERQRREEEELVREVELAEQREREFRLGREMEHQSEGQWMRASMCSNRLSVVSPQLTVQVSDDFSSSSCPSTPGLDIGYLGPTALSPVMEVTEVSDSFEQRFMDSYSRSPGNDSSMSILKQSLNNALDKTFRLYKSSTLGFSRSNQALDVSGSTEPEGDSRFDTSLSGKASSQWDDEMGRESKSSLPILSQVAQTEKVAAENQLDRMSLWIKSVEKVVEEARQNFAASAPSTTLPPLPVAPSRPHSRTMDRTMNSSGSGSLRPNRVPRKILAANQIFVNEYESGEISPGVSSTCFDSAPPSGRPSTTINGSLGFGLEQTLPTIPSEAGSPAPFAQELPATPSKVRTRTRSHTIITRSPGAKGEKPSLEIDISASPSRMKEKSKSQNDLVRAITPVAELELQIEKMAIQPAPKLRLSEIVDKNVFVAKSSTNVGITETPERKRKLDDLTASPFHVDPYPPRPQSQNLGPLLDTPARKHVEGVYDRFLMSTTGVRRAGKGYQSDNGGPVGHLASPKPIPHKKKENFFSTKRKGLPPPVSSDDWRKSVVDEFGAIGSNSKDDAQPVGKGEQSSIVRRALRTIVNGKR